MGHYFIAYNEMKCTTVAAQCWNVIYEEQTAPFIYTRLVIFVSEDKAMRHLSLHHLRFTF